MRFLMGWLPAVLALSTVAGPAHAEWHEARSKHFIVYADDMPERLVKFAEQLERFDQAVRYLRAMEDPSLTDSGRVRVYVLSNDAALGRLYGGEGVLGFYDSRASGSVAFVPRHIAYRNGEKLIDEEAVFFHEYAHHLQLQTAAAALPFWVVEGFAEFFATAEILEDGGVGIGKSPKHRAYSLMRSGALSIEQLVGELPRKLDWAQVEEIYGRGWLLMHYLSFEPSRRGQLSRYEALIQEGVPPLKSAQSAFGDLKTLNAELKKYFAQKTLSYVVVPPNQISVGQISIRQLRPGEAAIMPTHLRTVRGVKKSSASDVAADARKIAARYGDDPFVLVSLAEAELDADNFVAAEAAADRAVSLDPKSSQALVLKGRARMELAKSSPANADWKAIRALFSAANKLDTEKAEALKLFYQSYVIAGQRPTKNAVDGLVYAVDLAPRDAELRSIATIEMLAEGRLDDARDIYAPLAFQPHGEKEDQEAADKVRAAMDARDAKSAIALLTEAMEKAKSKAKRKR